MENKITNNIKAKIFAQYIGAEYVYKNEFGSFKNTIEFGINTNAHINNKDSRILLKKLENISDEDAIDAIQMQVLVKYNELQIESKNKDAICFSFKPNRGGGRISGFLTHNELIFNIYQFLQSKGYALPYMEYSVEELVELGVYKLK